eukprot:CAMPEP_0194051324 /NCGR_PEP_ID=MMETSP0009_2-20130614/39884_1 /TAXON_ID=210454 /ORGANISM="Grammatophora oceanica, Strain CCMP 410" /LENGTH=85 /DNA_ID=CAMNT_0038698367 /DNA_START=43 /DNA_END=296 /DNA_ORIENTATION=+
MKPWWSMERKLSSSSSSSSTGNPTSTSRSGGTTSSSKSSATTGVGANIPMAGQHQNPIVARLWAAREESKERLAQLTKEKKEHDA